MPKKKYLAPTRKQSLSSEQNYKDLLQELKSILARANIRHIKLLTIPGCKLTGNWGSELSEKSSETKTGLITVNT
jgi:hypothetical protein